MTESRWFSDEEELVEFHAKRLAMANNGGEWSEHYTEEQKNLWRKRIYEVFEDTRKYLRGEYDMPSADQ